MAPRKDAGSPQGHNIRNSFFLRVLLLPLSGCAYWLLLRQVILPPSLQKVRKAQNPATCTVHLMVKRLGA